MQVFSKAFFTILLLGAALVLAACDDNGNGDDDADSPDVSDTTPIADEPADDDVTPEMDADPTPELTTTPEVSTTPDMDSTPEVATTPDAAVTPDLEGTPSAGEDAEAILDDAADRVAELETARFRLDGTGSIQVEEIGEVSLSNAEGAVQRPDRAQVEFDLDVSGMEVPLTVVSYEDEVYFTDVFSGEWHSAPEEFQFDPAVMFDEDEGLPALIESVKNPELLGTAKVDDRDAYQIAGEIDRDLVESGTAGTFQPGEDVDFEVWIDQESSDVLLVRAEDPTAETDSAWEIEIFDHNESVEIEEPDVN